MPAKKTVKRTSDKSRTSRPARRNVTVASSSMVGPIAAIRNFWIRYFDFMGLATRSEFWFGVLFVLVVNFLVALLSPGIVSKIVNMVLFIPTMALTIRRFRDAGLSVWFYIVPMLVLYILPIIKFRDWSHALSVNYMSPGMALYSLLFMGFGIFVIIVACLRSKK